MTNTERRTGRTTKALRSALILATGGKAVCYIIHPSTSFRRYCRTLLLQLIRDGAIPGFSGYEQANGVLQIGNPPEPLSCGSVSVHTPEALAGLPRRSGTRDLVVIYDHHALDVLAAELSSKYMVDVTLKNKEN